MRTRFPVVLAVIAALLWAPPLTSAAGNSLAAPSVSPASGTITTVFTLSVNYDGKFPATAVSVSVAGIPLPMARVDGTATRGTWSVSTLLPAGTWMPTFSATAVQGNTASITGPTISVAGPTPHPSPAPTVSGPSPRNGEIDTGDPGLPTEPADPVVAPAESGSETAPSAAPDPAASTAASPAPDSGPAGGGTTGPAEPSTPSGSSGGTDDGDEPAEPAPADAPRAEGSRQPAAQPASDTTPDDEPPAAIADRGLLDAVLLIGLSGVAAVAIIGTALLVLGRRRRREDEEPIPVPERTDTDALLERRTLRRAKVRLSDDPITAAMGVDDQVAARRLRSRASQVSAGPGERPTRPTDRRS